MTTNTKDCVLRRINGPIVTYYDGAYFADGVSKAVRYTREEAGALARRIGATVVRLRPRGQAVLTPERVEEIADRLIREHDRPDARVIVRFVARELGAVVLPPLTDARIDFLAGWAFAAWMAELSRDSDRAKTKEGFRSVASMVINMAIARKP